MTQRTNRVDELLRQEIGELLTREISDPRIGFATITDVETAPDLRHAKVWVSVIGTDAERVAAVAALQHAMPFIRHQLGVRLRIKRIPELHVRLDETMERGTRLLRLLSELEAGTDPDDLAPTADALPTPVGRLPHEGDAPPELVIPPVGGEEAGARPAHGRRRREGRGASARPGGPSSRPGSGGPRRRHGGAPGGKPGPADRRGKGGWQG